VLARGRQPSKGQRGPGAHDIAYPRCSPSVLLALRRRRGLYVAYAGHYHLLLAFAPAMPMTPAIPPCARFLHALSLRRVAVHFTRMDSVATDPLMPCRTGRSTGDHASYSKTLAQHKCSDALLIAAGLSRKAFAISKASILGWTDGRLIVISLRPCPLHARKLTDFISGLRRRCRKTRVLSASLSWYSPLGPVTTRTNACTFRKSTGLSLDGTLLDQGWSSLFRDDRHAFAARTRHRGTRQAGV